MRLSDLKYLMAYIIPVSGYAAVYIGGWWSYITMIIAFVMIPVIEFFVARSRFNISPERESDISTVKYFDWLLYLNIPLVYGLLLALLIKQSTSPLSTIEQVGMILSVGTVFGASGINVAHELGHKKSKLSQFLAKVLLLPNLYMHFFIEHNRGHHVNVSTPKDPATSRKGEILYLFWIRSTIGSYINAWKLEIIRLSTVGESWLTLRNEMIVYQIVQSLYLFLIWFVFGISAVVSAIFAAIVGFLLLETINYIEHYGLMREKLPSGRYERVAVRHSWNSNHELGRIILYELTRHSDHHYKTNRKYQVLRHHDESPQLPLGYPGSMLLSMCPPLWFFVMNPVLNKIKKSTN